AGEAVTTPASMPSSAPSATITPSRFMAITASTPRSPCVAGARGPQARLVVRLMNMVVVLSLYWMGSAAVLPGMLAGHCGWRLPAENFAGLRGWGGDLLPHWLGLGWCAVHRGGGVLERHGVGEVTAGTGRGDLVGAGRAVGERRPGHSNAART